MPDRADPPNEFLLADGLDALPAALAGGVVAIGNFDGMHLGHRALLAEALAEARRLNPPAVVMTFEPHPRTVFRPDTPVFRLTSVAAKRAILEALGFAGMVVVPFDRPFSQQSAESFVEDVLVRKLAVRGVAVGFNFHFGKDRKGTPDFLVDAGRRHGFAVRIMPAVGDQDGEAFSSYRVRMALEAGDIAEANALLGYRWFILGEVVRGAQRGRLLGFPTANIELSSDSRLRHGIYAVRLRRPDNTVHDGVASFGRRPMFDNGAPLLEVFLLDFEGTLYGETVEVSFFGWIRPELRFDSVDALTARMAEDVAEARAILSAAGPGSELDRKLAGNPAPMRSRGAVP